MPGEIEAPTQVLHAMDSIVMEKESYNQVNARGNRSSHTSGKLLPAVNSLSICHEKKKKAEQHGDDSYGLREGGRQGRREGRLEGEWVVGSVRILTAPPRGTLVM